MKKNLIFGYILLAAAAAVTANCNLNCTVNGMETKHIACGNNGEFGRKCPQSVTLENMTESRKNLFLHEMNVLRNFVAGGANSTYDYKPACGMAPIQWDDDLAEHAALNAKQCKHEVDYCHTTDRFRSSGQAAFTINSAPKFSLHELIQKAIQYWTETTHKSGYGDLLADRNTHTGCAIAVEDHFFKSLPYKKFWMVCNFATDIHGRESMYEICESAGEKCKNKPIARYPNLCAVGETNKN